MIDSDYVRRMQLDQLSPSAQTIARVIGDLQVDHPRLAPFVLRMRAWDGTLTVNSPQAAIYQVFVRQLLQLLLEHHLGDLMPKYAGALINEISGGSIWGHHSWEWLRLEILRPESPWFDLGGGETRADALRLALDRTIDFLSAEQGPDPENWTWGHFHQLTFQHQLGRVKPMNHFFNRGPYPIGGDGNTIWASASLFDRVDSSDGMVGPPFRLIADLADLSRSQGVLVPGNSGQPGSPHYDDQLDSWFRGEYHPLLYTKEIVLGEQEALLELLPR